jgi:ABC-type sugar transport system ATPase subunit
MVMEVFRAVEATKVFGKGFKANDGLTLAVEPGEVYGLLGPNGAGKSTFVKAGDRPAQADQWQHHAGQHRPGRSP